MTLEQIAILMIEVTGLLSLALICAAIVREHWTVFKRNGSRRQKSKKQ